MEMEMKKLVFGTMRLPVLNQEDPAAVDLEQLQLNYIDWDSPNIQSRQCYEVCRRYGKDVIVMEPVKGGTLAHVPREARDLMEAHAPGMTPASWAVRFAASREGVIMVLSGMSDYSQLLDNTAYMQDFVPLTEKPGTASAAADARPYARSTCPWYST